MTGIQTVAEIESAFREFGRIKTAREFADLLGENPNGLSDIKAGRKKLTIDHIRNLKNSHTDFNLDWFFTGEGSMFLQKKSATTETTEAALLKEAMQELREQLAFLRSQNTDLTKALLKSKMVEEG
jgi:hypothetical protein